MNIDKVINALEQIERFDSAESKDWNRGFDDGKQAALDMVKNYDDGGHSSSIEIPQFVADWIESQKQNPDIYYDEDGYRYDERDALANSIHFTIYCLYASFPNTNPDVETRKPVLKWLEEDRNNYFKLVDAVRDGYKVVTVKWPVKVGDLVVRKGEPKWMIYTVEYVDEEGGILLSNGVRDESYSDDEEEESDGYLDDFYDNFRLLAKKENLED